MNYNWQDKIASGEYIYTWNGYEPYWAGCFYGDKVCLGGEDKFKHCYDFFSGIGDAEWWIKAELDILSDEDRTELLNIMARNKKCKESITRDVIKQLSEIIGVDTFVIYSLGNRSILRLMSAKGMM
jgi:hypothetical protein